MAYRFGDLPIRTKFLITLAIPVLGMVLLIGKQVDGSIKRRNVLTYIRVQSDNIEKLSAVVNELQRESALSTGLLLRLGVTDQRLELQRRRTDEAIASLGRGDREVSEDMPTPDTFAGIEVLRERVSERRTGVAEQQRTYRSMRGKVLDALGRVAQLPLDPETKDRLYSHLSLLYAKEALAQIRSELTRVFTGDATREADAGYLGEQLAQYDNNMRLFERDASPDILELFKRTFQGQDVNMMRSVIGTIQERGVPEMFSMGAAGWWEMSMGAMDKLRTVEDASIASIKANTAANLRDAEQRLLIVLLSLVGVITAVAIMAVVLTRGIRRTVNEVTNAASAMATGDVSAHVRVDSADEIGSMARSFNDMIDHMRSLANSADAIGKGNYEVNVDVRSDQDTMGNALQRMRENLYAARERDLEQTRALQAEKDKLQAANERISVLIKEIHHRVKNNLQVVASLLRLQSATIDDRDLRAMFDQSQSRVRSMALIHEKLYKGDVLAQVNLSTYLKELFAELIALNNVDEAIRYRTTIDPDLALDLNTMVPLGLLLNELITNSFKHAFVGRDMGNISLSVMSVGDGGYDLVYEDDGVGIPRERLNGQPSHTLGMDLIESLTSQLNGFLTVESNERGTRYQIRFREI